MADYFGQFVDPEDEKRKRRTTAADTQDFFGQFLPPEPKGAKPGIVSDIKRGFGQMIGGIGSSIRDLGAEELGQNIENYGTDIARRHPSEINSFQDVLESPLTTAREATGEQVSQLGSMFTGMRLGALIGSPLGPVGQIAGGFIGGLTPLALQTYGGIRQEQRIAGIDDKGRAILATVPSVALERLGGPEKLVSKFSRLGLGGMAREAGEAGLSLPGYVGRQALKGGAVETITEIPQTALERYGAYKDLLSPEAIDEYGVAGAKAFAGGGVYSGGFAAITPRVPAADTAGTPGTESSSAQRQLFTTNTEGMASPLNTQQVTELADVRDMLRARMQAAESRPETLDPLEYKEMRETVERIERILAGTQSDQMTLDLDPFRYSAGLQGRKERTPSRTNFQKSLFAPEVGPDFGAGSAEAPLDLLVLGQYTPTAETIALPQVSTREAYARAVEKAKRGESLSKLEEYLLENPPESAGVMTSETGAGTMQQRMLAGPQAFRDPVTAASGMRTRTQEPTQMDMFGNPIDLNQATTLQPGLSVAPMQDTPLTNLQQPGQTEMFDGRGQPTYNAAPVGTTTLAEARLRAEGAIPTTKRMEIAVKAEEALAAGTIDEPTYDQIFTLLRESKYAKASKLVGETSVAQTTQTKQAEAQRSQAPVAGTAPATAPTVEQPTVAEVPNAVQVESAAEVPVQSGTEVSEGVGQEVRSAQEPTAESRQEAKQDEEVAVEGRLTQREAITRLMKEAGMPRADAKAQVEALVDGMGRVDAKAIDKLVVKNKGSAPMFSRGNKPLTSFNEAFRKWFKNSKVVDKDGNPMVVYHTGTFDANEIVSQAEILRREGLAATEFANNGIYFSPNPIYSSVYGRGKEGTTMYPVYLSIQKPFVIRKEEDLTALDKLKKVFVGLRSAMQESVKRRAGTWSAMDEYKKNKDPSQKSMYISKRYMEELRSKGYDGIINLVYDEIVVFEPTQIKSATGNIGTYSPTNSDIRYARGAKAGKSTVTQVSSWLEPVKRLWGNAAPTEIVQSVADLPAEIAKDAPADAKGLFHKGQVYIVADNHATRTDALVTLFHEMIGHYGIRSLVRAESTEYVRLMTKLENQNDRIRADAAAWRKNNPNNIQYLKDKFGYTDTMIRAVSVEEAMADMAYEALQNPELRTKLAKSPMLRTLTSWISKALRAIGMAPIADKVDALNSNLDVFALLSLSRDFVERGQKPSVMEATNVPMFSRGGVASATETGQLYGDYGKMVAEVMVGKIKRTAMNFRFLRDLRRSYGNKLAGLSDYVDKAFAMGAMTNQLLKDGGQIVSRWGALGQELEPVNELASFASAMEIYPDLPLDSATHDSNGRKLTNAHLLDESGNVSTEIEAAHAQLQEMWRKLSPTARKVYLDARDYLHKTWMQRQDLLNKNVDAIFNPLIAEAKRLGNDAKVKALTKERNKQVAEFGKVLAQLKGPYFPSERFGDYYVSYKSDEFKAAEAELDDATQALADLYGTHDIPMNMKREIEAAEKALSAMGEDPSLFGLTAKTRQEIKDARKAVAVARAKVAELTKAGEKHYTNESFESEIAAKLRAKELGVGVRMAQEYFRELNPVTRGMVEKMADAVGGTLPEAQAAKAREAITQIYLAALPQTSALKAQIKRKGVAGADQDMLRVFSSRLQKDAHYLSRLAYMDDMTAEMLRMQKDRKTQEQDAIYNQMAKHHTASLQYSKTPIQDGLSSLAFVYQLGVSPAFLLSNMTQPFMVSVPYMSGKHNPGKASAAMFSAFADAGKAAAASFKKDGLHFEIGLDKFAGAEKAMLESAMREGLLDITLEMDIGAYAKGGSGLASRAMRMMGVLPHQVEVVNRVATALAAYRLELARTNNEAQATEYAKEVLDKTHFDYSTTNAPYLMKPGVVPLGKLLFQYRKYQIGMLTLMGNLTRDAIKSSDPVEKAQARRALLGTFVTYGLFTGASGLPFVGTGFFIAKLLGAIFGDDDEPNDPEADFRQYLADLFGVDGGVIAAKGLPALLGVDASRILGAGDIAAPIRSIRWDKEGRNLYTEILIAGLGPTLGGLGPQFAEGLRYLDEGDYYRGAQNLTPRFIRDGLKAMQMADDGVTTTKGQQVMEPEEIAASDIMLQAFGVPTTFVTERQAAARAIQDAKQTITDRRKLLMRNFVKARIDGDNEGMQDAREAINKFNETRRARGEPIIKWKDLTAAYKQRRTYAKNMNKYGVSLGKKERAFEEYGNFAAMDNED